MRLRDEAFDKIINTLNKYNYCILRNFEILPEYENDIDILVEKENKYRIINDLNSSLLPIGIELLQIVEFSCTSVFYYDKVINEFIHIDFYDTLRWKVFEYLDCNIVLSTKIKYRDFFIPNEMYNFYEILLTRLIPQKKVKENYKSKLYNLSLKIDTNYKFTKNLKSCIYFARERRWDKIEENIFFIKFEIIIQNLLKPEKIIGNIFSFIVRSINRLLSPPGLFIAFYGVDGSGKSTQIKLLSKELKGFYSDKIKLFHFRPNIIYKKPKDIIVNDPHNQKKTNFFRALIKLLYYVIIYNWGYITQILPTLAKNGIVIFDRYYFDLIIDPKRYRIKLPNWITKFLGNFIPKPDLNICLLGNPFDINFRKTEIIINEIEEQQIKIQQIFTKKRDYIIRTDCDPMISLNEIKKILIKSIKNKFINFSY